MKKFVKRCATLLMAGIMVLGMSFSAFASEPQTADVIDKSVVSESETLGDVSTYDNTQAIILGKIQPQTSASDYGYLDHYIGLNKTFKCFLTTYGSTTGNISVILYKPNGETATSFTLNSSNPSYSKTFFLPSSGDYRMVAFNNANREVTVTGLWY